MSLRHAVLGFLSLRPLSGYDLKKYFDASVRHFWTADQAQIYRALGQLADDGLVEVDVVAQVGRPDRKEHHITPAGLAALDDWLRAPMEPHAAREPFLVKVFFASRLSTEDTAAMLDDRIAAADRQLGVLRQFADDAVVALAAGPPGIERLLTTATLENGIQHVVTELDWLRDLRRDLDDVPDAAERVRERLTSTARHDGSSPPTHEGDRS